jgi:cell division protein FtsB
MLTKFKKNEKWQRKKGNFFSIIFFLFVGIGIILITTWLIIGNLRINQKRRELDLKINSLIEEIQKLQEEEGSLQSQIFRTKEEEDEHLEEVAKDKLDLKREGEKVISVVFEPDKENPEQNQKDNASFGNKSILQKIFQGVRNFFISR